MALILEKRARGSLATISVTNVFAQPAMLSNIVSGLNVAEYAAFSRSTKAIHATLKPPFEKRVQIFAQICSNQTCLDNKKLAELKNLALQNFDLNLSYVDIVSRCKSLTSLSLDDDTVSDLDVRRLPQTLKSLKLRSTLMENPDFRRFQELLSLDLAESTNLKEPYFEDMAHLKILILNNCRFLKDPNLQGMINLEELDLSFCLSLIKPSFEGLVNLQRLSLADCEALKSPNFEGLNKLQALDLSFTPLEGQEIQFINSL